jgi:hypothetical protein
MATAAFGRVSQWLRANTRDTSHDGRIGTVAATGKRSARFGGSAMATAPFGRSKSAASCQYSGHITRWAYWDSRRYRKKIRITWRRRDGDCGFWLGASQRLRANTQDTSHDGRSGTVAATGKDPHDLEAARWRLRLLVGASQWLRANTQDTSHDGRSGTVAATGKRAARFRGYRKEKSVNVLRETRKTLTSRPAENLRSIYRGTAWAGTASPVTGWRIIRARIPRQYLSGNSPIAIMKSWLPTKTSNGPNA